MTVFVQTLLDLGASTDYKDSRGLTPLYHSAMVGGDPYSCELLLHDYAKVGCIDENGWQEIHQVSGSLCGGGVGSASHRTPKLTPGLRSMNLGEENTVPGGMQKT